MFDSHKYCGIGVLKGFVSLTMVDMEKEEKETIKVINSCKEDNILHEKHEPFTFELPLMKLSWLERYKATKKVAILKRYIFSKRVQKSKNIVMTTFHNFVPKIENGWVKRLVKTIL